MTKQKIITPSGENLPKRTWLNHNVPLSVHLSSNPIFFITLTVRNRHESPLIHIAEQILSSARFYKNSGKWFPYLLLVMPDHIHILVSFPVHLKMTAVIGNWKKYIAVTYGIQWEQGFFDTRIRDEEHYSEQWEYILNNPVRKELVPNVCEWRWKMAFNPRSGDEFVPSSITDVKR